MIPFARISTYGNKVINKKIKKFSQQNDTLILQEDGTLYGAGYNGYGLLCTGDKSVQKNWVMISTDVDDIVIHKSNTLVIRKGNRYYGSGLLQFTGTQSGYTSLYDVTDLISSYNDKPMKYITGTSNVIFGLTESGELYGFSAVNSRGVLGDGSTENSFSYKLLANSVSKIYTNGNNSFYIDTNGNLYGTGWNNNTSLGFENGAQVNSWVNLSIYYSNLFDISKVSNVVCGTSVTWILNATSNRWYSVGSISNGRGSATTKFGVVSGVPVNYNMVGLADTTFSCMVLYNNISPNLMYSGTGAYLGVSTSNQNSNNLLSTSIPSTVDLSKMEFSAGLSSIIFYDKNTMYVCGDTSYIVGFPSGTNYVNFKTIQLPEGTQKG